MLHQQQDNDEKAGPLLEESVAVYTKVLGPEHPDLVFPLRNLASVEAKRGNLERAVEHSRRASDLQEANVVQVLASGSEREKRAYLDTLRLSTDFRISLHTLASPESTDAASLALISILRDKGRVLDMMASSFTVGHRQPVELEAVRESIADNTALVEFYSFLRHHINESDPRKYWGRRAYAAYVLTRTGEPKGVILGDAEVIDAAAKAFRDSVSKQSSDVLTKARELDALTMEKVRPLLVDDVQNLVLSPDGELNIVPFAAVVDEQDDYLIERYGLSYVNSGRDLLRLTEVTPSREGPLLLGDAAFGGDFGPTKSRGQAGQGGDIGTLQFDRLEATAGEVAAIGRLFGLPEERVLTGASATEAAVKAVKGPTILHLATHGFFLPDLPVAPPSDLFAPTPAVISQRSQDPLLRSGLALSGFNHRDEATGDNDGMLTALEFAALDLQGTEIVTLSACETGLGEVRTGEGVFGLRRAVVLAGARTQVMSLWQVADQPTADLMVSWYQQLAEGVGRSEAMRRVQIAVLNGEGLPATNGTLRLRGFRPVQDSGKLLESRIAETRHPYYWASFIVSGETGPVTNLRTTKAE